MCGFDFNCNCSNSRHFGDELRETTSSLFEVNKITNSTKTMLPTNNLEVQALNTLFQVLPNAIEAFCKCDEIIQDHEEKQALKYSEQEYLKAIHRMYKAGKISGEQAKQAMNLIFKKQQVVEAKVDPVEQELLGMINIPIS